jgi:hypothetical protein
MHHLVCLLIGAAEDGGMTRPLWQARDRKVVSGYPSTGTREHYRIDPLAYLWDILTRLPTTPPRRLDEFLPESGP